MDSMIPKENINNIIFPTIQVQFGWQALCPYRVLRYANSSNSSQFTNNKQASKQASKRASIEPRKVCMSTMFEIKAVNWLRLTKMNDNRKKQKMMKTILPILSCKSVNL